MKHKIYAVHDIKAELYHLPYFSPNEAVGLRTFATGVSDPTTDLNRNPEDYSLHCLGEYDMETGEIKGDGPTLVALAMTYAKKETR